MILPCKPWRLLEAAGLAVEPRRLVDRCIRAAYPACGTVSPIYFGPQQCADGLLFTVSR